MTYRILYAVGIIFGILSLWSCAQPDRSTPSHQDPVSVRVQNPDHPKYDFERDPESLERIRTNITKIRLGDTPDQVVGLIGSPTSDFRVKPKTPEQSWKRRDLQYDVKRLIHIRNNERYDQLIVFSFDENDHEKLVRIYSNVPGIATQGNLAPPTRSP